jgi:ADP-heptose:LPS heptosyltransferase
LVTPGNESVPVTFFMKKTKFLIIRLSSIGDIVLTSPLVRCLTKQVENAEIHFVTKSKYCDLLSGNPYIHKIHYLNDHFDELLKELKSEKADYIIDLHQNFRSFLIKRYLCVPSFSFNKLNLRKWIRVRFGIDLLPVQHVVERYFRTVSSFNVVPDNKGLDYFVPDGQEFSLDKLPDEFRNGYIAFIIGGTYATKRLPVEKITTICRTIRYPVVLIGGTDEKEIGDVVSQNTRNQVLNLAGNTSINESASLVRDAKIVLTNDTGMMHIAAAFGKKIFSFWGNTIPKLGMSPYLPHPDSRILEVKNLACRPCSKLGYQKCPKEHFRCMMDMDMQEAIIWIERNY